MVNGGNCIWGDINWVHYVHAAWRPPLSGTGTRRLKNAYAQRTSRIEERASLRQRTRGDRQLGTYPHRLDHADLNVPVRPRPHGILWCRRRPLPSRRRPPRQGAPARLERRSPLGRVRRRVGRRSQGNRYAAGRVAQACPPIPPGTRGWRSSSGSGVAALEVGGRSGRIRRFRRVPRLSKRRSADPPPPRTFSSARCVTRPMVSTSTRAIVLGFARLGFGVGRRCRALSGRLARSLDPRSGRCGRPRRPVACLARRPRTTRRPSPRSRNNCVPRPGTRWRQRGCKPPEWRLDATWSSVALSLAKGFRLRSSSTRSGKDSPRRGCLVSSGLGAGNPTISASSHRPSASRAVSHPPFPPRPRPVTPTAPRPSAGRRPAHRRAGVGWNFSSSRKRFYRR